MIQSDFDAIAPLAQEGGYPFPELKLIQDQVQVLFDEDPLIPEEMHLNSLIEFHETYQTISCSELRERTLMLDLDPLRGA